ncbi:hypothetical protein [Phaeovulum sp. W22_SRMD_FR3]|uniref:hypothetical protein n=1 Tax=Phaeovulum sp. W22_SRMD_FR3 TaxID=3240274 RepID=UPI003F9946B6
MLLPTRLSLVFSFVVLSPLALAPLPLAAQSASETAMVKMPDTLVTLRDGIEPTYGWGDVEPGDIGQVRRLDNDGDLVVDFPGKDVSGWASPVDEMQPVIGEGMLVERGPDWKWQDQDGGAGRQGNVTALKDNGWVEVTWPNGTTNDYRWDQGGLYDLRAVDLGMHASQMAGAVVDDDLRASRFGSWTVLRQGEQLSFVAEDGGMQIEFWSQSNGWFDFRNQMGQWTYYSSSSKETDTSELTEVIAPTDEEPVGLTKFGEWRLRVTATDIYLSHPGNDFELDIPAQTPASFEVQFYDGKVETIAADTP